ncbi:MAG: hypothetical protein J2P36_19165, partial [Ktedonobacteraceae bacterium]|nr:hypothetical protein [Ktedonobacteraceae bacterium]
MLYLSQLLGAPVENQQRARTGKLLDVLVPTEQVGSSEAAYPSILLIEDDAGDTWRIASRDVERRAHVIRLRAPLAQLRQPPAQGPDQEISLAHDVLDRHVIHIERKKAIRVSDVCFEDDWRILGIDNSPLGLIRRLVPAWIKSKPASLVPWDEVELVGSQEPRDEETLPTHVSSGHLAELHPADIAEIVHQLSAGEGARLIERLDDETAAATMEEVDTERQRQILENIQLERAADILQTMGPDE